MDKDFTKYCSNTIFPPRSQTTQASAFLQIGEVIEKQIRAYHKINKYFPDRLIVYRDGVGESQEKLLKEEI